MQSLKKYYIGLSILAFGTLILLGVVVVKSSDHKTDKKTNDSAYKISEDLNSYIREESAIPDDLSDVTDEKIPDTIKFTKESDIRYEFCITYKDASNPTADATTLLYQGLYGGYPGSADYNYQSSYAASELYISTYSWNKGDECQFVEPILNNYYDSNTNFDNSSLDYLCEPDSEYYDLYKEYCVDGKYQPSFDN